MLQALILGGLSVCARARLLFVSASAGTDVAGCGANAQSACHSLQFAVNASGVDDTIYLVPASTPYRCEGVHLEWSLSISSWPENSSVQAVFDCDGGLQPALWLGGELQNFSNVLSVSLNNLVFRNGGSKWKNVSALVMSWPHDPATTTTLPELRVSICA